MMRPRSPISFARVRDWSPTREWKPKTYPAAPAPEPVVARRERLVLRPEPLRSGILNRLYDEAADKRETVRRRSEDRLQVWDDLTGQAGRSARASRNRWK